MFWLILSVALATPADRIDHLLDAGKVSKALRVAERHVRRDTSAASLEDRARVREAMEDLPGAVSDYVAARTLDPARTGVLAVHTVELLVFLDRLPEARDWAEQAVLTDQDLPGDIRSVNRLTLATLMGNDANTALFDQAVAIAESDGQKARAHAARAMARGNLSDARRAIALAPETRASADGHSVLADHGWNTGNLDEAELHQAIAVRLLGSLLPREHTDVVRAWASWGATAERRSEPAEALRRYQQASERNTDPAIAPRYDASVARIHLELGEADAADELEAAARAAQAVGDTTTAAAAHHALARHALSSGNSGDAQVHLQATLDALRSQDPAPTAAIEAVERSLSRLQASP